MIGRGSCFFAVWGYVISHMMPDREVGTQVELNPDLIAFVLGEAKGKVEQAIGEMCQPDIKSRTKELEGRKLVKLGEYSYRVVNGEKYRAIRDEEKRREQNRVAQEKFRKKEKKLKGDTGKVSGKYLTNEKRFIEAEESGNQELADSIAAEGTK